MGFGRAPVRSRGTHARWSLPADSGWLMTGGHALEEGDSEEAGYCYVVVLHSLVLMNLHG